MTSHPVDDTVDWFEAWRKREYARMDARATNEIILPEGKWTTCEDFNAVVLNLVVGPILTPFSEPPTGDPFPHSMEPQLRALGLSSSLVRGVPSLNHPHTLCRKGEKLSSEKCRILKLLGVQMAVSCPLSMKLTVKEFRVLLGSRWSKDGLFDAGRDGGTAVDKEDGMDEI